MQLETFRLLRLYVFLRTNQLALYFFDFAFVLIFYFRYAVVNLLSYSSMFATAFIYCFWATSVGPRNFTLRGGLKWTRTTDLTLIRRVL